jgi:zinc transport system substrate-binding protein
MAPLPPPLRRAAAIVAMVAAASGAAGCSSSLPRAVNEAPVLSVATGLWPLEQAATLIGGDKVAVDDVVPAGDDPLHYRPTAADTRVLAGAGLVLLVGGGFQPALEAAAAGAPHVARLEATLGASDPYLWLDPATMGRMVTAVTDAMAAANPAAAALYRRNADGLKAQVQSLGIDFASTLSACPGTEIVTPDPALTAVASANGLTDLVVAGSPSPADIDAVRGAHAAGRRIALLREPWVSNTGVAQVAAATGLAVHDIDTLAGPPTGGTPAEDTYFAGMEQDLGTIATALGCNTSEQ